MIQSFKKTLAAVGALAALSACSDETDSTQDPAVARGEMIYRNICVVCHNADPKQDGALGPAIAHTTRAVLEAKVLRGEYPKGYTPARNSEQMPQFEYLEPNLADIAAFLASQRD